MTDRHTITDPHAIEEIDQLRAQVVSLKAELADRATASKALVEQVGRREEDIKADERQRIAAGIEDQHQPGTYPYAMAQAIRANKTPDGSSLSPAWHEHAVTVAKQQARALCIDELRRLARHRRAVADTLEGFDPGRALEACAFELAAKYLETVT